MIDNMTITLKCVKNIFFKDWRICDQTPIEMNLKKENIYYIHAKAWHIKGFLGGTHSYFTFYHLDKWLVVELTDMETLGYQNASILFGPRNLEDQTIRRPYISNRKYNAKWFGNVPKIVGFSKCNVSYEEIVNACKEYKITDFSLLRRNCNTFASYVLYKLNLDIKKPLISIGFKNKNWWMENYV